jgi:hypothetical protein
LADSFTNTKRLLALHKSLEDKREEYIPLWKEIQRLLMPEHGQFISEGDEPNRLRDHSFIYGQAPKTALQVLSGGLQSMIPRNQKWLSLGVMDPDKTEFFAEFFETLSDRMLAILELSNFYSAMSLVFDEFCSFGVGIPYVQEDFNNVVWLRPLTVGEYSIGVNSKDKVNTLSRSFYMNAINLVDEFGNKGNGNNPDNVPQRIRDEAEKGKADGKYKVIHIIKPNDKRQFGKIDTKNKKFISVYLYGEKSTDDAILRESGYNEFPAPCIRWKNVGSDIYGTSPAIQVLWDIRALYKESKAKMNAINHQVDPALNTTPDFHEQLYRFKPGATFPSTDLKIKVAPVLPPGFFDLRGVSEDILTQRDQISNGFMNPLFLMPTDQPANKTAFQVGKEIEQKDAQMGHVVHKIETDLLDPVLDRVFEIMLRRRLVPDIPPELAGENIKIEYISMLSRASREMDKLSIGEAIQMFMQVAQVKPDIVPLLNGEELMRKFIYANGAPTKIFYDTDTYRQILQQEQEAAAAKEQELMMMEQGKMAVDSIEKLSKTDTSGQNALTALTEGLEA